MSWVRLPAGARLACFVGLFAIWSSWSSRGSAADTRFLPHLPALNLDNPVKVVHLRKLARKLLHWGHAHEDEDPIQLGPAFARLLWQKKWKWPEAGSQRSACGLLGGPMLSVGLPFRALGRLFSIETRFSSFRYAYADLDVPHHLLREFADPHDQRQSVEGALFLSLPLAELF